MVQKFTTENAEKLSATLSNISEEAQLAGYLVGIAKDIRECVKGNLKDHAMHGLVDEIDRNLTELESNLAIILTSSIVNSKV